MILGTSHVLRRAELQGRVEALPAELEGRKARTLEVVDENANFSQIQSIADLAAIPGETSACHLRKNAATYCRRQACDQRQPN